MEKQIIACLDMMGGRVKKGVQFENIRDMGDPLTLAMEYDAQGADIIMLLFIAARQEALAERLSIIRKVRECTLAPLYIGGGVQSIDDIRAYLDAGADRVSIGTAAVQRKELIAEAAAAFGSEKIVLAMDASEINGEYHVMIDGGRTDSGVSAVAFAKEAERLGAGSILLTSKDADGMKDGYDLALTDAVAQAVQIPVIASGGCGKLEDFASVFQKTRATGALAASLFHEKTLRVDAVKQYLSENEIVTPSAPYIEYFRKSALVPAIIVDDVTKDVLMLGYMSRKSLKKTIETGETWFYSRSRRLLWHKGETSGNVQRVVSIAADCDLDTLLIRVKPLGPACHTGQTSCFFNTVEG